MGSGETSPTMVELHKSLVRRAGRVTVLDTPYGFQENADELSARAVAYFRESVGVEAEVVSLRTADAPAHETGTALAALAAADYVFCGPGSPTYALRQFRALGVADVLGGVVARGGVVCLASAASVTAGELSIPVYEIYKVGQAPYWEEGADVLGRVGLRATVVPHFNNTEGGTHDTSCCYVGRRRLTALRAEAPDLPVLGIDEHTAVVVDPATGRQRPDPARLSDSAGFTLPLENPAVHALNRRIAVASGTHVSQGEPLQVLRYRPGGEYRPHFDAIPGFANQRILTMIVWLGEDYEGGETLFMKTGARLKGRTGDALLFRNALPDGTRDPDAGHAGLPVTTGEKLIASRWIRARPFVPPSTGPSA